jgi:hypothetical protein
MGDRVRVAQRLRQTRSSASTREWRRRIVSGREHQEAHSGGRALRRKNLYSMRIVEHERTADQAVRGDMAFTIGDPYPS